MHKSRITSYKHGTISSIMTHTCACRAMNRQPQEADCNGRGPARGPSCTDTKCKFHMHKRHCGGAYDKVRLPLCIADG